MKRFLKWLERISSRNQAMGRNPGLVRLAIETLEARWLLSTWRSVGPDQLAAGAFFRGNPTVSGRVDGRSGTLLVLSKKN
jgi:hypothetical protein